MSILDNQEISEHVPERVRLLKQGCQLTAGPRDAEYGDPIDNLGNCADLWQAYLYGKYGGKTVDPLSFTITAEDVAWFNVLQKIARTFSGKCKPDTYLDAAVYSAIAGEIAIAEADE